MTNNHPIETKSSVLKKLDEEPHLFITLPTNENDTLSITSVRNTPSRKKIRARMPYFPESQWKTLHYSSNYSLPEPHEKPYQFLPSLSLTGRPRNKDRHSLGKALPKIVLYCCRANNVSPPNSPIQNSTHGPNSLQLEKKILLRRQKKKHAIMPTTW